MTRGPRCTPRTQAALGLALCVLLAWPALRHALEASMWRHMVLQFPLLMMSTRFLLVSMTGILSVVLSMLLPICLNGNMYVSSFPFSLLSL